MENSQRRDGGVPSEPRTSLQVFLRMSKPEGPEPAGSFAQTTAQIDYEVVNSERAGVHYGFLPSTQVAKLPLAINMGVVSFFLWINKANYVIQMVIPITR